MFCSNCGKENVEKADSCVYCGVLLKKAQKNACKKSSIQAFFIVGIIIALIIIIAFICFQSLYKGSFNISQSKDYIELGSNANFKTYLEYDTKKLQM